MTLASVAQVLLSGLQIGSIYALLALSYYVIIIATGILNFAQGEWMMVSGVIGVTFLSFGLPYPIAFCAGILGAAILALAAERLIIRPLQQRHASEAITLLALFGVMLVVRYGTGTIHGRLDEPLPGPAGNHVFRLGTNVFVFSQSLVIYGATALIFLTVVLWLRLTWLGRSLRVTAIDPIAATLVGVNLNTVRTVAFGLGALIAAIVAWLYAPLYAVGYLTGAIPGIKGFIALFIGGTSSPLGPLVGGLLLGVMEVAAARYLPSIYAEGIAFALLMIILFLRPSGLIAARRSQ
ncbi:MAG: branched-chain amino acid ABC transporter permease [Xanthobacteraceae bacterium]